VRGRSRWQLTPAPPLCCPKQPAEAAAGTARRVVVEESHTPGAKERLHAWTVSLNLAYGPTVKLRRPAASIAIPTHPDVGAEGGLGRPMWEGREPDSSRGDPGARQRTTPGRSAAEAAAAKAQQRLEGHWRPPDRQHWPGAPRCSPASRIRMPVTHTSHPPSSDVIPPAGRERCATWPPLSGPSKAKNRGDLCRPVTAAGWILCRSGPPAPEAGTGWKALGAICSEQRAARALSRSHSQPRNTYQIEPHQAGTVDESICLDGAIGTGSKSTLTST